MHLVRNEGGSWPAPSIMDVARHAGYSVKADLVPCDVCDQVFDSLTLLGLHKLVQHGDVWSDSWVREFLPLIAEEAAPSCDLLFTVEGVSSRFLSQIEGRAKRTPPGNIPFKLVQLSRHVAVKFVLGDEEWSE